MLGFKYNGVHSSTFGLVMRSKNRPVLPEQKRIIEEVPARNGVYDFSAANPYGHVMYKEREVSVECSFISASIPDLRSKVRAIASWLACGEARLAFDDEEHMYYLASVSNRVDLEQQITKIGRFTIVFTCRPFAFSSMISGEYPTYGKGLCYGDKAVYGGVNMFYVNNDGITPAYDPERGVFDEPIEGFVFSVNNFGTFVKPKIVIEGLAKNVKIKCGSKYLKYSAQALGKLVFDCENGKAVLNGNNITNLISGEFFELAHGEVFMQISADAIECDMYFVFNYLYF